jgi:hypothetical protein
MLAVVVLYLALTSVYAKYAPPIVRSKVVRVGYHWAVNVYAADYTRPAASKIDNITLIIDAGSGDIAMLPSSKYNPSHFEKNSKNHTHGLLVDGMEIGFIGCRRVMDNVGLSTTVGKSPDPLITSHRTIPVPHHCTTHSCTTVM